MTAADETLVGAHLQQLSSNVTARNEGRAEPLRLALDADKRRRTYLIQDPYDADAIQFIETIAMYFGLRPVCLYTNRKARFYGERQFPELRTSIIEEGVSIEGRDLASVCAELQARYDIVAVIPYREDTVELAAELCDLLALDWNDTATLQRFRDKFELKRHVREVDSSVRVPECRLVETVADVWRTPPPDRFVIKPNDGMGNQRIGIFDATDRDDVAAHVQDGPSTTWILEEFIDGPEFHVNGQVRSNGEVTVLAVFEYTRVSVNGYDTVYSGEQHCHTDHPMFDEIADYARALLAATGLRRCPFHLEVKVDDQGPCLIDLGARFGSEGAARTITRLHPDRPDTYAVAAHDYIAANQFAMSPVDFTYYDRERAVIAYGISDSESTITSISGLDEVEALPEFVVWPVKPKLGDQTVVTKELRGAPYIVELRHYGSPEDSVRLVEFVQNTIRWNTEEQRLGGARVRVAELVERAGQKLRWLALGRRIS